MDVKYIVSLVGALVLGGFVFVGTAHAEEAIPSVYCGVETLSWQTEAHAAGSPTRFIDLQNHWEQIGLGNCMPPEEPDLVQEPSCWVHGEPFYGVCRGGLMPVVGRLNPITIP